MSSFAKTEPNIKTFQFFCAQLADEEGKKHLHKDLQKRRARMSMERFKCKGWLNITISAMNLCQAGIRLTHHGHKPYVSIGLSPEYSKLISDMRNQTPSKIWDVILQEDPNTELTEKQIQAEWTRVNQDLWRLDDDQLKSVHKLLQNLSEDEIVENIPVTQREGTSTVAFAFKEILDEFGGKVEEVAMDSTCKFWYRKR